MALDGSGLGAILKSKLAASATPTNDAELTNFCNAIGKAIVEYVTANAIVVIDTAVVTSGAGAGGAVTGTGKLT